MTKWIKDTAFPRGEAVWTLEYESGYYVVAQSVAGDWYAGWTPEDAPCITDDTFEYFDTWQAARKYCEGLQCHTGESK